MQELTKPEMTALLGIIQQSPEFALRQAFKFGAASKGAREVLKRAADMLDMDAEELKFCHAMHGNWSGEAEAKADYDERKKIAKALRGLA